jgi:hypothetical protein
MMGDAHGRRRRASSIVCRTDEPGKFIFRPLQPFETDNGLSSHLRVTLVNCHVGKHIDFLTRRRWLDGLGTSVLGKAAPRVRNVSIKQVWIETMHDRPGAGAEIDNLLALMRPMAARPRTTSS